MARLPDWLTGWLTDKQCARGITSIVVFHCSLGNFVARQLKLWKLIKLKRLPRGRFRWVEIRAWPGLKCMAVSFVLCFAWPGRVKTSQVNMQAKQPFSSSPGLGFGAWRRENLLLCIQAEIKAPCRKAAGSRDKVQVMWGAEGAWQNSHTRLKLKLCP